MTTTWMKNEADAMACPPLHPTTEAVRARAHTARMEHRADALVVLSAEQAGRCAVCNRADAGATSHPDAWSRYVQAPPARERWAYVQTNGRMEMRRPSIEQLHTAMALVDFGGIR